jgi:outer membrane protein assembly factor BamB
MKIRCACGVKYEFEVTPDMWQNPVKFVCTSCGLDSSEYVNQMVREEIQENFPEVIERAKAAAAAPPAPRLKLSHAEPPAETPAPAPAKSSKYCAKHHGALATSQCTICGKPICPKCMEEFGYFCSPFCKNKADQQGIAAPVYAGQKFELQKNFWRKTGSVIGVLAALVVAFFIAWTWYAWFGSVPHKYFAVRFEDTDRSYYGKSVLAGKDQLIYLHGGTLGRVDLKLKKEVWSQPVITKQQIDDGVKAESDAEARMNDGGGYQHHRSGETIERQVKQSLQARLNLHVNGQNIWIAEYDKMTSYDWESGKVLRSVALPEHTGALVEAGGELQMVGEQSITHVSLASGETRVENFNGSGGGTTVAAADNSPGGGLPGFSGDAGKPLDPAKVEAQAQNLKLQGRLALPALIANAQHEADIEAALRDDPQHPRAKIISARKTASPDGFELVAGRDGYAQIAVTLLEQKITTRTAMKPAAAGGKSILDSGNLNVANEGDAINQQLNEMQRRNGGDTVTEDESRYRVTIHLPGTDSSADWTGEVAGPPHLFVLKTVNVLAAGKSLVVLDKTNKQLWQASLTYAVSARGGFQEEARYGDGPCVERGGTLYVFDQAVLTCFDLANGNARWRLPSVGIVGLFFDDANNVYVNTTTGNPDDVRFSRQIDINRKNEAVFLKLDPRTGKTLWRVKPCGFVSYLSGKFIYAVDSFDPNPGDEDVMNEMAASLQKPPFLHLQRLNPKNGRVLCEYYDRDRCPVDVRCDANSIQLIFKREVQVLRYLTF